MIEEEIVIKADTSDAKSDVDKLTDAVSDLTQATKDQATAYDKGADKIEKANKGIEASGKSAGKGINAIGTAFKALGIGLIIALVAKMTAVFAQNQKVMDTVDTVMTTLSIVFNEIFEVIGNVIDAVSKSSEGFEGMKKVITGMMTIALTPLKLTFFAIKLAIQEAQLIWEKSFFGGGDEQVIADLTLGILETKVAIVEVGKAAIQAGSDVVNNLGEAFTEIGAIATIATEEIVDGISGISISAAYETAQAITDAQKNFELLALQQTRLQLQYQTDAELLRQIRDNDAIAIQDRIKANDDLAEVLLKQGEAEAASVQARIDALLVEQEALGFTIERQNEIFQLQTDLIDVNERLTSQESEQLTNKNALLKEQQQLLQSKADSDNQLRLDQLAFEAEQAETEAERFRLLLERNDIERQLREEDLENKIESYAEGTQARIDAEIELNEFLQQNANERKQIEADSDASITEGKKKSDDAEKNLKKKQAQFIRGLEDQTINILSQLGKKGAKIAKGLAVAQATRDTYKAAIAAYAAGSSVGGPAGVVLGPISAALAVASGLLNIKSILSTPDDGSGGAGGGSTQPKVTPPSFNLVAGTEGQQISDATEVGANQEPARAYVVTSDVTTGQELDRNLVEASTL